jgi:ABC-type protease/lipase transport system fused ATPase/permease subunit
MNGTDKILAILGAFMLLFVIAILFLFHEHGNEPSTLIAVVGGAIIAEIAALCKIKTDKRQLDAEKEEKAS